jgi:hypothetical protein
MQFDIPLGEGRGPGGIADIFNPCCNFRTSLQVDATKYNPCIHGSRKYFNGHFVAAMKTRSRELNRFTECLLLVHVFI